MSYRYNDDSDIMKAFFKGKIKITDNRPKPKTVELGHGKGIGHSHGSYSQYIKKLEEQASKGNGIISIGKSVIEKDIFSMPDHTDKFTVGEIPHILITYYGIINPIAINTLWKNSDSEVISEHYYEIPSSYSLNYNWWDSYSVLFLGPENLEEGDYKVDIISTEFGRGKRILSTSIGFIVQPD